MDNGRPRSVLVFDLDDTLYLERDFVESGFRAANDWLASNRGLTGLAQRCQEVFAAGERQFVFDRALALLGAALDENLIRSLVEVYQTHSPTIALAADARRFLSRLEPAHQCAIITDGNLVTQQAKVKALGLDSRLPCIIYTDAWGRAFWKPHHQAFEAVEKQFDVPASNLVYIADNPRKDFVAPRARGWLTIQVARPQRIHQSEAAEAGYRSHATITSLDELDACLRELHFL
jgi:putative hydrolase of the HAD superfamily